MEKNIKFNAESIADGILKECACDEFENLLSTKQDIEDQIVRLRTKADVYKNEIIDFTDQISKRRDLIEQKIKAAESPETITKEIRSLETDITDRENWIKKTETSIGLLRKPNEVNSQLRIHINNAIKKCRAELIEDIEVELSKIIAKQSAFTEACGIVGKSIEGLGTLSSNLPYITITFNQHPLGFKIQ